MKHAVMFCVLLVVLAGPAMAQDAKVDGAWALTMETPRGTSNSTLTLKQAEQTLTGTYAGRAGEIPVEGTIKGSAISFAAKIKALGQEIVLTFTGTVEQDRMKGSVAFGGMGSSNWTGVRKK